MRKAMRGRDGLKEKCNKSRNSEYWENYQLIKNKIVSIRKKALQGYAKWPRVDKYANQRQI